MDILDIPKSFELFSKPELGDLIKNEHLKSFATWSKSARKEYEKYQQELSEWRKNKTEAYSLWCDTLYKLSIANYCRDEILFFPHNIDFRGRVYPVAPYFHHMVSTEVSL